jgi:hypothetical protein
MNQKAVLGKGDIDISNVRLLVMAEGILNA